MSNPHLPMRIALSGGRGMLISDGDEKPYLINCEVICVHEECSKIQLRWIRGFRMSALQEHKYFSMEDKYVKKYTTYPFSGIVKSSV